MVILAPRPDFTKREGSPCPKWGSLASDPATSGLAGWPLAAHSAPAPAPAATPASAAACFRNRLRPDGLDCMIASRDSDFYFELCLGAHVFAKQLVVSSKIA